MSSNWVNLGFSYLWVALGGALGSSGRYTVSVLMARYGNSGFPFATLFVNVVGSFIIGLVWIYIQNRYHQSENLRLLVVVGFLGGFTTFSSFSLESMNLILDGHWFRGGINIFLTLFLCLAGVLAGMILGRLID